MLFLGAGASAAFGIHDVSGISAVAKEMMRSKGYETLLERIHSTLLAPVSGERYYVNEQDIDIEVILSILDLMTNPDTIFDNLGVSTHYLYTLAQHTASTFAGRIPSREQYTAIRSLIENEIVQSCNQCNFFQANKFYSRLFTLEGSVTPTYLNAQNECPCIMPFKHVVTTNYDLVLERYDKDRVSPAKHFLRRGLTRGGYCWDEPYLNLEDSEFDLSKIEYLKLHGSIDWWIRFRDNNVVSRESPFSLFGETYLRRQMIYPVYDKHISEDPFSYLFNYFLKILKYHEVYVVVGFSFRDPSINNAFRDALSRRSETRMIVVNRNSEGVRNRLGIFPNDKLDVIQIPFGEGELINELEGILNKLPRGWR